MKVRNLSGLAVLTLALLAALPALAAEPSGGSGYHVMQKLEVGGEGGWDYLIADGAGRRVYVTRGTHVMVLDADSGKVVGDIPQLSGIHGVAIAPEAGRGFISDGRASEVVIFDLKSLKVLDRVKSGENPDAIIYDPATRQVFAFNGRGKSATVIDAASGKVTGTISLAGKPEFATSDGKGRVFVNLEDKNATVALDAKKLTVLQTWQLEGCEEPSGMAIDRAHGRLVVGCGNKVMEIVDTDDGKVVAKLPIGEGVDANGFDPGTGYAFSSNRDGTLTVAHEDSPDKWVVVDNVHTQQGARTMAVDEKTHKVFVVTANFNPPPAPTKEQPRPRPTMVPNSFVVLVVGR